MLEFKDILLEDKQWVDQILSKRKYLSCEYCFGNHFIWKNAYKIQIAKMNEFYVVLLHDDEGEVGTSFLYPAGSGDIKPVIEALEEYCKEKGIPLKMHSASEEDVVQLEKLFPQKYEFESDRDYSDYIYNVEDLTNLSGKKLHGKRNHIARFKENNWKFEPITNDNFEDCIIMNKEWCEINDCGRDEHLKDECCAIKRSFKYFHELNFFGGLIRIDNKVVAYTIAERLNDDVVVVHMEKAFSEIQGAYPAINREFVANMCQSYKYVNREEDLGVEGLRKAKLSYRPAIILEKFSVKIKE
ncbi:MAG: phosphatidylglycerol lysyltransferase domain-containing protein [Oscillospiraceae bacterium]